MLSSSSVAYRTGRGVVRLCADCCCPRCGCVTGTLPASWGPMLLGSQMVDLSYNMLSGSLSALLNTTVPAVDGW